MIQTGRDPGDGSNFDLRVGGRGTGKTSENNDETQEASDQPVNLDLAARDQIERRIKENTPCSFGSMRIGTCPYRRSQFSHKPEKYLGNLVPDWELECDFHTAVHNDAYRRASHARSRNAPPYRLQ